MANTFFVSDTHFDHTFVAGTRGFDSAEEHDAHVIRTWNKHVKPEDTVWHLGDVGMGALSRFEDSLKQLNGHINLITGNHDEVWGGLPNSFKKHKKWMEHFDSIQQFAVIKWQGNRVMLSHFPPHGEGTREMEERHSQFRLRNYGAPVIHGHTHSPSKRDVMEQGAPTVHVGWDAWGRPVDSGAVFSELKDQMPDV